MPEMNANQLPLSRQAGSLFRSCRVELIALAITLGLCGLLSKVLPPALAEADAIGISVLIFLLWGAVCVVLYRVLLRFDH